MGVSGNSVAGKSFQMFTVSEELLAKVVEAVQAGEKKARSSGDIQSLEVFCHGFRQNISLGRVYIVPPAVCNDRQNFPTALLHGALVRVFGTGGEEIADLIDKKIGESEFDEYSQADFDTIKKELFVDPRTEKEACLIIFAPNWMNTREFICFHFTKDAEQLKNNLRHQVFAAYFNPAVSSAFNALMTNVNTTKVDVTDITPKLSHPFLSESILKEHPKLEKQAGFDRPTILLNRKTADEVTKQTLDPQELDVFDALDSALEHSMLPDTRDAESAGEGGYTKPDDGGVPRAASKNAHKGPDGKCLGCKESADKCSCAGCKCASEDENPLAAHETPFTNVGPGTRAEEAQKDSAPAMKESLEQAKKVEEKATDPIGIELDEQGRPVHKGDKEVKASKKEAKPANNQTNRKHDLAHPETLRVGQERLSSAYSAAYNGGFVDKHDMPPQEVRDYMKQHMGNNGEYAPHALADHERDIKAGAFGEDPFNRRAVEKWGKVTASQVKADFVAEHIAIEVFGDEPDAASQKFLNKRAAKEAHLDKFRSKEAVSLDIDSIWDEITEDMGPAPLVDVDGSAESNPAPSNTEDQGGWNENTSEEDSAPKGRPNKKDLGSLPEAFKSDEPEDDKSISDSEAEHEQEGFENKESAWRVDSKLADFVGEVYDDVNNEEPIPDSLYESAKAAIEAGDDVAYDVASENGQMFDNVKHMQWFIEAVAREMQNYIADYDADQHSMEGQETDIEASDDHEPGMVEKAVNTAISVAPLFASNKKADTADNEYDIDAAANPTNKEMGKSDTVECHEDHDSKGQVYASKTAEAYMDYDDLTSAGKAAMGRIQRTQPELVMEYGYDRVLEAAYEATSHLGDLEEIGSSDVSIWVHRIEETLAHSKKESNGGDFDGTEDYNEWAARENERDEREAQKPVPHTGARKKADTADNPANESGGEGAINVKTNKEITNTRGKELPKANPIGGQTASKKKADTADNPANEKGGEGAINGAKDNISNTRGEALPGPDPIGGKSAGWEEEAQQESYRDPSEQKHRKQNGYALLKTIRPGDRVTILVPAGRGMNGQEWKESTGRAVIVSEDHVALNMGGQHGTPGVATAENIVRVHKKKQADTADNPYNMENDGEGAPENKKVVVKKDTSGPTPVNTKQGNQNKGVLQEVGEKHDHGIEGDIAQARGAADSPDSVDGDISQPTVSVQEAGKFHLSAAEFEKLAYWMNEMEIQDAEQLLGNDPVIGPYVKFLAEFRDEVNSHSDGWAYWRLPANAAKQLMALIKTKLDQKRGYRNSPESKMEVNEQLLRKAMGPIKSFYTRRGFAAGMKMPNLDLSKPVPQGTEGQDRESYSDDQDRENYHIDPNLEKESAEGSISMGKNQGGLPIEIQRKREGEYGCNCPAYAMNGDCKHCDAMRRKDQAAKSGADISGDMSEAKSELNYNKAEIADEPQATQTVNPDHFAGKKAKKGKCGECGQEKSLGNDGLCSDCRGEVKSAGNLDNAGGTENCYKCGQPIADGEMTLYGEGGMEQHQDCQAAARRAQQPQPTPSQRIQNLPQRGNPKSPEQLGLQRKQDVGFAPMSSKEAAAGDEYPEEVQFDFGAGDLADIVLTEETDESE